MSFDVGSSLVQAYVNNRFVWHIFQ